MPDANRTNDTGSISALPPQQWTKVKKRGIRIRGRKGRREKGTTRITKRSLNLKLSRCSWPGFRSRITQCQNASQISNACPRNAFRGATLTAVHVSSRRTGRATMPLVISLHLHLILLLPVSSYLFVLDFLAYIYIKEKKKIIQNIRGYNWSSD